MTDLPTKPDYARALTHPEASGPTDASTCSTPPKPKSVPPRVRSLISKLGLRFAPSLAADMEAHSARVALLAEDVADADPDRLQQAVDRWVATKPFLPKASELREIMAEIGRPSVRGDCLDVVGIRNAELAASGSHLRWAWNNPNDRGAGTHLTTNAGTRDEAQFAACKRANEEWLAEQRQSGFTSEPTT